MIVQFFFNDAKGSLSNKRQLNTFIKDLFSLEGRELHSLKYIFCSDEYLLSINREFLQHDDYTDVITFCLSEEVDPVEGEIYISIDRVRENAKSVKVTFTHELHRVIFHGALHLCGFTDKKPTQKLKMTTAENKYLDLYFK